MCVCAGGTYPGGSVLVEELRSEQDGKGVSRGHRSGVKKPSMRFQRLDGLERRSFKGKVLEGGMSEVRKRLTRGCQNPVCVGRFHMRAV